MAIIGTFRRAKNGGWDGIIRTFSNSMKARFVPNDDRHSATSPDFHLVTAQCDLGMAWLRRKVDSECYLSVQLDDPHWVRPISAALFFSDEREIAELVWRREPTRPGGAG